MKKLFLFISLVIGLSIFTQVSAQIDKKVEPSAYSLNTFQLIKKANHPIKSMLSGFTFGFVNGLIPFPPWWLFSIFPIIMISDSGSPDSLLASNSALAGLFTGGSLVTLGTLLLLSKNCPTE